MGNVALITGVDNRAHDGGVVQLLDFIGLMAPRDAGDVIVRDMPVVGVDGGEDVAAPSGG